MASARTLTFEQVDTTSYLLIIGVVIAVILVAGAGVMVLRRRLLAKDAPGSDAGLFEDLRRMRDEGKITPEEYERARRTIVERLKSRAGGEAREDRR